MILEALQSGPKRYQELPQSPTLDFQLKTLLRHGKVIKTYDYAGVCRFMFPVEPPEDNPTTKSDIPRKDIRRTCKACGDNKRLQWFWYDNDHHLICMVCHKAGKPPKLPNRPTCIKCHKRKMHSFFVYDGKPHLTCVECK